MEQQKRQSGAGRADTARQSSKKASKRLNRAEQHRKMVDLRFVVPMIGEGEYFQQVHGYGDQRFAEATIYVGA